MNSLVRSSILVTCLSLAFCSTIARWAPAATVDLAPFKDNTLIETPVGNSNGAGDGIYVGRVSTLGEGTRRRGVIAFNLSSIPASSTINSVTLTLEMTQSPNGNAATTTVHRLNADWGEAGSFGAGTGAPAQTGDATWVYRFFATNPWATAGGDFVTAPSASQSVLDLGSYAWTGPSLVTDVQFWLNNPTSNFGWLLLGDESTVATVKKFSSSEGLTPPKLTVVYTPTTGVDPQESAAGASFAAPWPSPASGSVHLGYSLPREARVTLSIHDIRGRMVRRLLAGDVQSAGAHPLVWDGSTDSGVPTSSGLYLARLVVDQDVLRRRILLVR